MRNNPKVPRSLAAILIVFVLAFSSLIPTRANPSSLIDFEGIPEGAIVSSVYYGYGVSGDPVSGSISVFGLTDQFGRETNAAMIYDATCSPGGTPADCSGGDDDLFRPEVRHVLIISNDLDSSNPDDADWRGSYFEFDYSNFGSGTVTVDSIYVLDVEDEEGEGGAVIEVYSGGLSGTLLDVVSIPYTGNNGVATVTVGVSGVDFMRVTFNGSGAISNIRIQAENVPTPTPTAPTLTPTEPTAAKLLDFRVEGVNGRDVTLAWQTAAEVDNYGFRIYRSSDSDFGNASLVHFEPAGRNRGGNEYSYQDTPPAAGRWWYWLADVDTSGAETLDEEFSPVEVRTAEGSPANANFRIFLPISISGNGP